MKFSKIRDKHEYFVIRGLHVYPEWLLVLFGAKMPEIYSSIHFKRFVHNYLYKYNGLRQLSFELHIKEGT